MDDHELLRRYVEDASEDAFCQLVKRHAGLVYGVALRQLRRPHQAEEVTHAVFGALARKAGGLSSSVVVAGWLFRAARFASAKFQRDEERRLRREQEAAMMMHVEAGSEPDVDWEKIVPLLDAELEALAPKDRDAVLLRFFENHSFKEVGDALGASEDAAKMRVSRALEKLHQRFLKRGLVLSATAVAGALESRGTAAVIPSKELMASVAKSCLGSGAGGSLTDVLVRKLFWWKWKLLIVGGAAVVLGIALVGGIRVLKTPAPPPQKAPTWPPQP
jgi:RNA polymerase sigma factor (sigma-70 family)